MGLAVLACNMLVIWIFLHLPRVNIPYYNFLSLAISDIASITMVIGLLITNMVAEERKLQLFCRRYGILTYIPFDVSLGLQTLMCIDRCRAIVSPVSYRQQLVDHKKAERTALLQITMVFILTFIYHLGLAIAPIDVTYFQNGLHICHFETNLPALGLLMPFTSTASLVQIITFCRIIHRYRQLNKFSRTKVLRACKAVGLNVLAFYVTYFPSIIIAVMMTTVKDANCVRTLVLVYRCCILLNCVNCMSPLFIYYHSIAKFRLMFYKLFRPH